MKCSLDPLFSYFKYMICSTAVSLSSPPPALHQPAPSLSWQAQTPDATCGRYFICCIWFLSRFDKPLCWQPQKCLWACHMVKTPNWLSELPTTLWLTGEQGEIALFVHVQITSHVSDHWVLIWRIILKVAPTWVKFHPLDANSQAVHNWVLFP